jgi:guanylate kinase
MSGRGGKLVVISGPSGAGKTSVCKALRQRPGVEFSVSATTRPMRPDERDGVDYHFLTRDEFERRIAAGEFLEHASYSGNLYGTPMWPLDAALAKGHTFVLEIEVKGTRQLRERGRAGVYIFIAPPSLQALRERLLRRGTNSAAEIEARMAIAEDEMRDAQVAVGGVPLYDHHVVNVDLPATIRRVEELIGL